MKRLLIIILFSVSQISHGMGSFGHAEMASDQENSPTLAPLIPYSEERYKANEEVTVGKEGVKIEFQLQNSKKIPIVKELVFYDSCSQNNHGYLKNLNTDGWNDKPTNPYITIMFSRHLRTQSNVNGVSHKINAASEVTPETMGLDKAASLAFLRQVLMFDAIIGGKSKRHILTAKFISSGGQPKYKPMEEFNEQCLGYLAGKSEKEILDDPEFKQMFNDPNYRIKNSPEEGICAETGNEVMERIDRGLRRCINGLNLDNGDPKLLYICSSRCTLNWALRYCTKNMNLPLQLNIPNCNLFCVNYYPDENRFQVLLDRNDMPCCVSPIDIAAFAFESPIFTPFLEEFYQEVSQVIQKKDRIDRGKIASTTISRSSSFSDRRSVSERSIAHSENTFSSNQEDSTEKKSISRSSSFYIESEPISRNDSFQEKKSLTY